MIHINDILIEYNKLQDNTYIERIKTTGIGSYDYKLHRQLEATDQSFSNNHALILAIILLKRIEVNNLLNDVYGDIVRTFVKYARKQNFFKNPPTYMRYDYVKNYLDYSLITGIDKNTTKKSLSMFNKQIVDKLFEINNINKQKYKANSKKSLVIKELNSFTLSIFKEAFQPNSLALTELKRVLNAQNKSIHLLLCLNIDWSNTIFERLKPSQSGYRWLYNNTLENIPAEIYNYIVVVGEKSFDTPVDNYIRYVETERIAITTSTDLANIHNHLLTKAALQASTNSPIYNYIIDSLQGTKTNLLDYITNLTTITNKLDY